MPWVCTGRSLSLIVLISVLSAATAQAEVDRLFVSDANTRQILMAETSASFMTTPLSPLPLSNVDSPVGLDYDHRHGFIYWTEQNSHTINRATLNGSVQEVIANRSDAVATPHGLALDLEEDRVFWLTAETGNLESANLDGTEPATVATGFSVPRGLAISYRRSKLFITTVGTTPAIETINRDGTDRQVLINTTLLSPSGIAFDFTESRLYWTDVGTDFIESMNPENIMDRTTIFHFSGHDLFSYGISLRMQDGTDYAYFTEAVTKAVYRVNTKNYGTELVAGDLSLPLEIHIYSDVCRSRCMNGGTCVQHLISAQCICSEGYTGSICEFDTASENAPLIFVCDEDAGVIYQAKADQLEFDPVPLLNPGRPIAVAYDFDQDLIFWVDASTDSLIRAFRNGSHQTTIFSMSGMRDIAIRTETQDIAVTVPPNDFYVMDYEGGSPWMRYNEYNNYLSISSTSNGSYYIASNITVPKIDVYSGTSPDVVSIRPSLQSLTSITLDRRGTRVYMLDSVKGTIESCGPNGEDQRVDLAYPSSTVPTDLGWYRGTPFWTDALTAGIGFPVDRRGLDTVSANFGGFVNPQGIYVFQGKYHDLLPGEICAPEEFACDESLCIPNAWVCDGGDDCDDGDDEQNCTKDEPGALLFLTDLSNSGIFVGSTNNLTFTELPLQGLVIPVAIDYDPMDSRIYWTDVNTRNISSVKIDGSDQTVVVTGLSTPDGLFVDSQTQTIYWTDTGSNTIEAVHFNGSNRQILVTNLDEPRGIIILPSNRMLYWTDWGSNPKIEMADLTGQSREVIVDTELGWPNGITHDETASRLYWCDAQLDRIESVKPDGSDRVLLLDSDHSVGHPFDLIWYRGTIMWTDWALSGLGVSEGSKHVWPKMYNVRNKFNRPGGFHLYEEEVCASSPCQNGATCTDEVNRFTCTCVPGYYGTHCHMEEVCASSPCQNGATCIDDVNRYSCTCAPGYNGSNCETDIDECASNPCQNGATCTDEVNRFTCTCVPGFTDTYCTLDIDECASNPCQNGATCSDTVNGYTCTCAPGFIGIDCTVDLCTDRCQHGGTCIPLVGDASCACPPEYTGSHCEEVYDPCNYPNDCSGIRICVSNLTTLTYICICPDEYTMDQSTGFCVEIDKCADQALNDCDENALCYQSGTSYTCVCASGFTGDGTSCKVDQQPCDASPCLHGACANGLDGSFDCTCDEQYEGELCNVKKDPILQVSVTTSPESQTVATAQRVELKCGFENVVQFWWEKDEAKIQGTDNQNTYVILSTRPLDIGYYRCYGEGNPNGGGTATTKAASIYIQDLSNVVITGARFNYSVGAPQDLLDSSTATYQDTMNQVTVFLQTGLPNTDGVGNTPMSVVVTDLRPGSVIADFNVFVEDTETSPFVLQDLVTSSLQQLGSQTGLLDTTQITINSTSICQPTEWTSPFGRVSFGEGAIGSWANSTGITCPFNTTNAYQPAGRAQCVGDRISYAQWQPEDNCGPFRDVTELLTEIEEVPITNETISMVTEQVEIITENTDQITSSAITVVSNIASNIATQGLTSTQVTTSVTSIISNIAQVDMNELQAAEEEDNSISKIVQVFEDQLNNVDVEEGEPFKIAEENIAVQVQSIPTQELEQGLVLSVSGDGSSDLSGTNITSGSHVTDQHDTASTLIAQVNIPPDVTGTGGNENGSSVRIIFTIFATPSLFISRSLQNFSGENDDVNRTANTPVIALSVGGVVVENLQEPVNLTFTALERGYENQTCVYWNETVSDWSTRGCNLVSYDVTTTIDSYGNETTTETYVCACDHLTNFAILMDIHASPSDEAYNILSYIGCSISMICLVVTLATYLWNRKLRSRQTHQIFICLCATLLGLYTTFIIMLALDTNRNRQEVASGACGFLASLVHYFVLSSIAWMGVEGYNTYLVIVRVFNSYIENFMIKAGLAAWGGPALVVILTGAIANINYAEDDICFLQLWPRIGGLLIPMAVILVANVIIFILVVRQLILSTKVAGKLKKDAKDERRDTVERIQNAVTILVLLGLTWIAGYLLLIEALSQVAQAIFIIFNSFQGLIIFLLYCVRKPVIRKQWGLTCSFCGDEEELSRSGTVRTASSSTSSQGTSWASSTWVSSVWATVKRKYSITGESTSGLTSSDTLGDYSTQSKGNDIMGISIAEQEGDTGV